MEAMPRVLDIGCGRNKRPNAIGIDRVRLPGVDLVHDLNRFPYPFKDNTFDEIHAVHVAEHTDSILAVMEEVHRIAVTGAQVTVVTPHYTDSVSWQDPTHRWHLNSYSFDYFDPSYHTNHYTPARYAILHKHLELASLWKSLGLQWLINLDNRWRALRFVRKFREQYLCFLLRGKQMTFRLQVIKPCREGPSPP
jgi:predicted SAM-dependent methyltransferase